MFITVAIIIQALFWVLLGFLLSLFFIKKEDPLERCATFVETRYLTRGEKADQKAFVETRVLSCDELADRKADQKILDVATEFYNDVNH